EASQPLRLPVRTPGLEDYGPALDVPEFAHPLTERIPPECPAREGAGVQEPDPGHLLRWLRPGDERCGKEGGRYRDERSPVHYSITSSARASTDGGMVSPSAFAVLRLMAKYRRSIPSTGRSPGSAPNRTRWTYLAESWPIVRKLSP